MKVEGGCYCGAVRYACEGEPMLRLQCHCRECQYISGGGPNLSLVMPESGFRFTAGRATDFARRDLEAPVTRSFCPECGTHLITRSPKRPGAVIIKVGTLDEPSLFGGPQVAIFTCDIQPFHQIPEGVPSFEKRPG